MKSRPKHVHKQHLRGGYIVYRGSELQRAAEKRSTKNVSWCISMFCLRYIFGCAEFFVFFNETYWFKLAFSFGWAKNALNKTEIVN